MSKRAYWASVGLTAVAFALVIAVSTAIFARVGRHMTPVVFVDILLVTLATGAAVLAAVRAVSWPVAGAAGFVSGVGIVGFFSLLAWFAPAALLLIGAAVVEALAESSWRALLIGVTCFVLGLLAGGVFIVLVVYVATR